MKNIEYLQQNSFEALCPKAVLFDMDGVLYDSMPRHARAWTASMKAYGITMTADDAYATEGARGVDTIRQMVMRQQQRTISEQEAQTMYDLKSRLFHEEGPAPIMPGIISLMQQMTADGLAIGVVTGSGQRPLIARLTHDFSPFITPDHIVTAYDVERGKPLPDPYLAGLKKMGDLQPWEAIVVENAPLGVAAGVAAHIFTIAVNTGPLPDKALTEAGANMVLPSMPYFSDNWPQIFGELKGLKR